MGLLDILNGMQNGPGGARHDAPASQSSGGMPTWMMALLGLLAYKAIKGGGIENMLPGGGRQQAPDPRQVPDTRTADQGGGGLGDILGGMLGGGAARQGMPSGGGGLGDILGGMLSGGARQAPGGGGLGDLLGPLLGGAAAGGALNGGLRKMIEDMQQNGQGDAAQSWVGSGSNKSVDPNDLANAIGLDDIDAVAKQTGMPREQLLSELSQHLPEFVNRLTPDGRLPSDEEAHSRWV
jgi:uncharacterized protein YidB (DUF937 family)